MLVSCIALQRLELCSVYTLSWDELLRNLVASGVHSLMLVLVAWLLRCRGRLRSRKDSSDRG